MYTQVFILIAMQLCFSIVVLSCQGSCRLVGGSKFYEIVNETTSADASTPSPTEKHDHMKPIDSDDEGEVYFQL